MSNTIITFPRINNKYTDIFTKALQEMELSVIPPSKISEKTIKFGVKNSSEMMCFPYKTSLGNMYESLEKGANTILMYDTKGLCRFRHYWILQQQVLESKGYKFDMLPIKINSFFKILKLSKKSYLTTTRIMLDAAKQIRAIDREMSRFDDDSINIGIIGEIYTVLEEGVNYNLAEKLKKYGCKPVFSVTLSSFISECVEENFHLNLQKRKYRKQAKKLLNGKIGGHGFENIYNTLYLIDKKIDGIIHLLPMSCMPETTIEPVINRICQDKKIPLLRIPIDETNSEANVNTRVETFVELIKRRKSQSKNVKWEQAFNNSPQSILDTPVGQSHHKVLG